MNTLNKIGLGFMLLGIVFPIWAVGMYLDTSGTINSIGKSIFSSLVLEFFGFIFLSNK